jgi:hypothetical protein
LFGKGLGDGEEKEEKKGALLMWKNESWHMPQRRGTVNVEE